tara:strand:+ start:684 stop:1307 length:624 start_codon:yes stop_codon:yes gene_type:complete
MKSLLSSTAYIVLNKDLARTIGLKEAVLLADLISKEEYFNKIGGCKDGYFFNTETNIFNDTTLTPRQQRKCLKTLKKHQIIDVKRMGVPAKNFYKINEHLVMQLLNNLSGDKVTTFNNNKLIRNNNKYFKEPTILDIENYCKERNNDIDAKAFFNFYESKGWVVGKAKMKDWKASIRTWETRSKKIFKTTSKLDAQLSQYEQAKKLL